MSNSPDQEDSIKDQNTSPEGETNQSLGATPDTSSPNVYTPFLTGNRLLTSASTSSQHASASKDDSIKQLAIIPRNNRGQRSLVKPFFCCGSELSLVSLVDGLELKDTNKATSLKPKTIECIDSSSDEEFDDYCQTGKETTESQVPANLTTNRSTMRRKKRKDKHSVKKKFWSLRLRGRWNTRWRVPQRSGTHRPEVSHNTVSMSHGTYQVTGSPGTARRALRGNGGQSSLPIIDLDRLYPTEDVDTIMRRVREEEMVHGVEVHRSIVSRALHSSVVDFLQQRRILESLNSAATRSSSPGSSSTPTEQEYSHIVNNFMLQMQQQQQQGLGQSSATDNSDNRKQSSPKIYTQVDYIHCLVPELVRIMNCPFYWGIMDRYEAERLLDNKPEGTFLLRDSAQDEFLFSVSFRRYNRCLHARVEQWNHRFSFDAHDPCVYSAKSVCELMEHYNDPSSCMFFEPMLTRPLARNFTFSLQQLCQAVICDSIVYDQIHELPLPNSLKQFLQAYHYKQKVRVRHFDGSGVVYADNRVLLDVLV